MADNSNEFLNRIEEIKDFKGLINHRQHRLLLVHGQVGTGKTYLLRRLRKIFDDQGKSSEDDERDSSIVSVLIDFRTDKRLTEPDKLINRLRHRLGGIFDDQMAEAEEEISRSEQQAAVASMPVDVGQLLARIISPQPQGASGGTHLSNIERVQVGGSIVGGHQTIVKDNTFVLNAGAGSNQSQVKDQTRRDNAFRKALKNYLAEKKQVILFFDHYEESTESVSNWLDDHVLDLYQENTREITKLWVVVAGQKLPLQDKVDEWRHLIRSQDIAPLGKEFIYLFWVDRKGLDKADVDKFILGSGENTKILFMILENFAKASRPEGSDGKR